MRQLPVLQVRKYLRQEFSLQKGASEQEIPKKNICQKIQEGFAGLKTLKAKESEAPLDCFPEVRPNLLEKPSAGIQYIRKASKNLLMQMIEQGRSQNEWEQLTTEPLSKFCHRNGIELLQLLHQIGQSWGPMVVDKMYGTKETTRAEYLLVMEQMTVREILAL